MMHSWLEFAILQNRYAFIHLLLPSLIMKAKEDDEKNAKALDEKLEDTGPIEEQPKKQDPLHAPGMYVLSQPTLADKLRKLYFGIRKDLQQAGNSILHDIESVGVSLDLGPNYYNTAASIIKSMYSKIKQEDAKRKSAEMYSLITGMQIDK